MGALCKDRVQERLELRVHQIGKLVNRHLRSGGCCVVSIDEFKVLDEDCLSAIVFLSGAVVALVLVDKTYKLCYFFLSLTIRRDSLMDITNHRMERTEILA